MKKNWFLFSAVVFFLLTSCSAEKKLTKRLVGEWNVAKYSEQFHATGASEVTLTNIGKLHLNKDGTGDKLINFSIMSRTVSDTLDFTWRNTEDKVTLISNDESLFAKTWLVMSNKKNEQVWSSTDDEGNSQKMELKR
ncbi:MAG: hypothetical protein ACNA7V_06225 [Bacteroidales bacterium]